MPEINPLSNDQIFLKKIAENTGSDYNTGDVSEINPLTIDQILLKEIAANTAGQSGDITELEEKVTANAEAIEAMVNVYGGKNLYNYTYLTSQTFSDLIVTVNADKSITIVGTNNSGSNKIFYTNNVSFDIPAGSYLVNGGLDASVQSDIQVIFYHGNDHEVIYNEDASYTFNSTVGCNFIILVNDGATVNATIKPMIRDARITDPTYAPYAMTNRELTEKQPVFVNVPIGQDSPITVNGNAFATKDITVPQGKRAYCCQYSSDSGYSTACITAISEKGDGTITVYIYNIYTAAETFKGHLKVACFDY